MAKIENTIIANIFAA